MKDIRCVQKWFSVILLAFAMPTGALSQTWSIAGPSATSESLKSFLRKYLNSDRMGPDKTTKIAAVSLKAENGKAEIQVVYVSGRGWCGSGGCTLLVLKPDGLSFKVIGRTPIVQLPVRLLSSTENGYPVLGVQVQGGGIQVGYEAALSFNGTTYSRNPSLPSARRLTKIEGKEIISSTNHSTLLYK